MKRVLFAMALLLLPVSAYAAGYGTYGAYGYQGKYSVEGYQGRFSPYGFNGPTLYVVPTPQPNIQPSWPYQNGLLQAPQNLMQQQMIQMYQQQMYMQQQAQQRQQIMAWQQYLKELGYDPGPIDGVHKPQLEQAYLQYLADQNKDK